MIINGERAKEIATNVSHELTAFMVERKLSVRGTARLMGVHPTTVQYAVDKNRCYPHMINRCFAVLVNSTPGQVFWTLEQAENILAACGGLGRPALSLSARMVEIGWIRRSRGPSGFALCDDAINLGLLCSNFNVDGGGILVSARGIGRMRDIIDGR
jgi:hypothetical protein